MLAQPCFPGAPAGTGKAKKSGAGGKFTWGKLVTDGDEEGGAMDRNDPNYNSGEQGTALHLRQSE